MFMRIDRGRFALREWDHYQEFNGKRRKINPIEEDIAVLPAARFLEKIKHVKTSSIFNIDYVDLIKSSENMRRKDAEETEDFVQIVSLFLVFNGLDYLAHRRTKKLPEKRLSSSKSLNFGGHLQLSDYPSLFERDNLMVDNAIQRELREELTFTPDNKEVKYLGAIYDASTTLGRQHVGLVFLVTVGEDVTATSNEPGFLTSLDFMSPQQIEDIRGEFDSWSMRVYDYHANRN